MTVSELLEYIYHSDFVYISDEFGQDVDYDWGYGRAQEVYDSLKEHNPNILSYRVKFIQANNTGEIQIVCNV